MLKCLLPSLCFAAAYLPSHLVVRHAVVLQHADQDQRAGCCRGSRQIQSSRDSPASSAKPHLVVWYAVVLQYADQDQRVGAAMVFDDVNVGVDAKNLLHGLHHQGRRSTLEHYYRPSLAAVSLQHGCDTPYPVDSTGAGNELAPPWV